MKKYLIILLCLALAISFAACSGDDAKKKDTSDDRADYTEPTIWQPKDKITTRPTTDSNGSGGKQAVPTDEMLDALDTAEYYLSIDYYSYSSMVESLEDAGYSHEAAVYAAKNCGADWKNQAYQAAESYLEYRSGDSDEIKEYLQSLGFTRAEAEYAAAKLFENGDKEDDAREDALADADEYAVYYGYSRTGLYKQLLKDGYTKDEAQYAVDNCDADWYDEAYEVALEELENDSYTYDELVKWLKGEGFSKEEAEYGAYYAKVESLS